MPEVVAAAVGVEEAQIDPEPVHLLTRCQSWSGSSRLDSPQCSNRSAFARSPDRALSRRISSVTRPDRRPAPFAEGEPDARAPRPPTALDDKQPGRRGDRTSPGVVGGEPRDEYRELGFGARREAAFDPAEQLEQPVERLAGLWEVPRPPPSVLPPGVRHRGSGWNSSGGSNGWSVDDRPSPVRRGVPPGPPGSRARARTARLCPRGRTRRASRPRRTALEESTGPPRGDLLQLRQRPLDPASRHRAHHEPPLPVPVLDPSTPSSGTTTMTSSMMRKWDPPHRGHRSASLGT